MLVSVVCPTFNCEAFVADTLESILNQTMGDLEVLVVDDCSSDRTYQIAESYAKKDPRVRLFRNESNKGAAYSRNLAISNAKGDYVAFLDGDDKWLPSKLEEQLSFMKEGGYSFSYTAYGTIDGDNKPLGGLRKGPKRVTHRGFLHYDYAGCLTVMYRRAVYPDLSIPDNIDKRNDYALWLKLSERCDCYYLDRVLSLYRIHDGSLSSGRKVALLKKNAEMFKKLYSYSSFVAFLCGVRNVFFWFYKKIRYEKRVKDK